MITLEVNTSGLQRKFSTLAQNASDLKPTLKRFGGYLRKKAKQRYLAQDFEPLSPATIAKREQRALKKVEKQLGASLRKSLTSPKVRVKTQQSRAMLLAEFQMRHRRHQGPAMPLSLKQLISLGKKVDKAKAKAVGGPILGKLVNSLVVAVNQGSVSLKSRTRGGWSDVHNSGDGHVPKRETLKLDADDLDVLGDMLKEDMLLGVEDA